VIFVDTNVFMYAVGGDHPLRNEARSGLYRAVEEGAPLVTSAEVLQELLHVYLPVGRQSTLDAALTLMTGCVVDVWPVEAEDVHLDRALVSEPPGLGARYLVHVACCRRRRVSDLMTFDRGLRAAMA
jgi:hypothetical protein